MAKSPNQQILKLHHLPGQFLRSAIFSVPLYAGVTAILLAGLTTILLHGHAEGGFWQSLTQWSLTAISVFLGLFGGGIIGLLSSAKTIVRTLEESLRGWFQQLPPSSRESGTPHLSLKEVQSQYDLLLDQAFTTTLGRIPLPGFLDRLIRSKMQQAIVGDFITSVEQRGLSTVGPQEFRNWLLTKGVSLGLEPAYDQLVFWQYGTIGVLGLLVAACIGITYFTR